MSTRKYIILLFLLGIVCSLPAQKGTTPPNKYDNLFEDLGIDDPAENSVLKNNENPQEKIIKNIFALVTINKKECFIGEPILLTYELYSSLQSTSTVPVQPVFAGFSITRIETESEKPVSKKIKGKNYRVFNVLQYQLIPFQSGELKISPLTINNSVSYQDETRKTHTYSGAITSNEISINVKPLPAKDLPANFSGIVGVFDIKDSVQFTDINAGENNILHIEISGVGNFNGIAMPLVAWPAGFEYFTSKESTNINHHVFPSAGKITFDIPFISKMEGEFQIPALSITYFDPSKIKYNIQKSYPIVVHVKNALDKRTITQPVTGSGNLNSSHIFFWLITVLAILLLSGFGWFIYKRKKKTPPVQPEPDPMMSETSIPSFDLQNELHNIDQITRKEEYIIGFKKVLLGYFQYKMGFDELTEDELVLKAKEKNLELSQAVEGLISECNNFLYANHSFNELAKERLKDKLFLLVKMENEI